MRVKAEQLSSQLQHKLPVISVIFGDEALLVEETADQIRQQARIQGIGERQVWHADAKFDWSKLRFADDSLSLFASQKLVEIRLPSGAPGKEGESFCGNLPNNPLLIPICY
jgi:DNA polymerase-3 subunit delta